MSVLKAWDACGDALDFVTIISALRRLEPRLLHADGEELAPAVAPKKKKKPAKCDVQAKMALLQAASRKGLKAESVARSALEASISACERVFRRIRSSIDANVTATAPAPTGQSFADESLAAEADAEADVEVSAEIAAAAEASVALEEGVEDALELLEALREGEEMDDEAEEVLEQCSDVEVSSELGC